MNYARSQPVTAQTSLANAGSEPSAADEPVWEMSADAPRRESEEEFLDWIRIVLS
jgi:hypothetical protein